MEKVKTDAEHLGRIPVNSDGKSYGGTMVKGRFVPHNDAELIRERDPSGATVVHPVRRSQYVHERMYALKKLEQELYDAAEKFRIDFERGQLTGNYAKMDFNRSRAGRVEMSDPVAAARDRTNRAMLALAGSHGQTGESYSQSCVWNVVGLGMTLENWTNFIRNTSSNRSGMNTDKAAGILHSSLERLAMEFGLLDGGKRTSIAQNQAYGRGIKDALSFMEVFFASASTPGEKTGFVKLSDAFRKRFQPQL